MRGWIWLGVLAGLVACSDFNAAAPDADGGGADAGVDGPNGNPDGGPLLPGQPDLSLTIAAVAGTVSLLPGQTATVKVALTRGVSQRSDVKITVSGLPSDFTPPALTIPGGASAGDLQIVVPASPSPGPLKGQIVATAVNGTASAVTPLSALVHGKPGDPDLTFGTNGKTTDLLTSPLARVVQVLVAPDGSLFALGQQSGGAGVAHLSAEGKLDSTYGSGGEGTIAVTAPIRAAVQKDGKLVIIGTASQGTIGRLDAKGLPDMGFTSQQLGTGAGYLNAGGLSGSNDRNSAVAVRDSDGAIFVAFENSDGATTNVGQLRLDSNGAPHATYGAGGGVRHLTGYANGILVRNNPASASFGSVTVGSVGQGYYGFTQQTGDNAVDPAAGVQPKTTSVSFLTSRGTYFIALGLVELADGSTIMPINADGAFYLRKFDPAGNAPATPFGTAGLAGPFMFNELVMGMTAQPDGKALVLVNAGLTATVFRFTTDGTIDTAFGNGGTISFSFNNNYPPSIAAGADRIVVSYVVDAGGATVSTLASFWQ